MSVYVYMCRHVYVYVYMVVSCMSICAYIAFVVYFMTVYSCEDTVSVEWGNID